MLSSIAAIVLLSLTGTNSIPSSVQTVRIGSVSIIPNGGMTPPRAVSYTIPTYTAEARSSGIEGTVTVQAAFDIEGKFTVLRVVRGLGFGLDENALAALQDWRFAPAYRSGRRVAVVANIDIAFDLKDDRIRQISRARAMLDRVKQFREEQTGEQTPGDLLQRARERLEEVQRLLDLKNSGAP